MAVVVHISTDIPEGSKLGSAFVGRMGSLVSEDIVAAPPAGEIVAAALDTRKIDLEKGIAPDKYDTRNSAAESAALLHDPGRARHAAEVVVAAAGLAHNSEFQAASARGSRPDIGLPVVDSSLLQRCWIPPSF